MAVTDFFSEQELDAVRAATEAAEAETGGELVCVIVERCDTYEAATWKAATLGALSGTLLAWLWHMSSSSWGGPAAPWILLPTLVGAALGFLLVLTIPTLQRLLTPPGVIERRVDRRATKAFAEEEIFATRDRTGVLIFLAMFEHQIRILCDKGVEETIPPSAWTAIADELALGLRTGRQAKALLRAIEASGSLLNEGGVTRRSDDRDELDNEPRLYDE